MISPLQEHHDNTLSLAKAVRKKDIYDWLVEYGYFPESYILPPCFKVERRPNKQKVFYKVTKKGKSYIPMRTECINVHFPKTELTDRNFGIMDPLIHNDIAYHISNNWKSILKSMFPKDSEVVSYSFPVPIDARNRGRLTSLRAGRMIYEFIGMIDDDIASIAYKYSHIVKADIKSFYPSIYTHSIAWAIHGKSFIRRSKNMHNYNLLGNRLDKLFQNANDGCTNGVPIGPVVSDIIAEIIASGVDVVFTKLFKQNGIDCEVIRFKDDYRILVKSEIEGKTTIKLLQQALKEFHLELSDEKTSISTLPDGLFRPWVSLYHAALPRKKKIYTWKEFRELYLAVLRIDKVCPGTGIVERFLADILDDKGSLKVKIEILNLQKVISMLLMLGSLRIKAFPKIVGILEVILRSPFGMIHQDQIITYLENYLVLLSEDEERNKYLISWISYFFVSNGLLKSLKFKPKYNDPITRSIFNNRGAIFTKQKEFKLFVGCKKIAKKISMLEHLDVFNPPSMI